MLLFWSGGAKENFVAAAVAVAAAAAAAAAARVRTRWSDLLLCACDSRACVAALRCARA